MSSGNPSIQSIAIIGAGIVGLSCALELADRGARVTLFEKQWPPRGASWAAAGMLAPAFEAVGLAENHRSLFELCDASARLWPDWAQSLEARSGKPSGYRPGPSLAVATDEHGAQRLTAVKAALAEHDHAPIDCFSNLHSIEPSVASDAIAAILLPSDGQVDNRLTLEALVACVDAHERIDVRIEDYLLSSKNNVLDHGTHGATLLTAGWQTGAIKIEQDGERRDVRDLEPVLNDIQPIGGQMLAVAPIEGGPRMTLRAGHVYIVPKADRIIIGATSEPGRVLSMPEPDQIAALRSEAIRICPVLEKAPVLDSWAGVRPGRKNHAPLLGRTSLDDVFVASGHFRNGILLAPITAQIMADLILNGRVSPLASAFAPYADVSAQV
ncbi:MAG: FAD-dependent oxidoreductase [Pseudomonadota bacterium]